MDFKKKINYYTFRLDSENNFRESLYKKGSPKQAVVSIFRVLLRPINEQLVETRIVVKNLRTGKLYYYLCKAVYNPQIKLVSEFKTLKIKYEINILKLNEKCF